MRSRRRTVDEVWGGRLRGLPARLARLESTGSPEIVRWLHTKPVAVWHRRRWKGGHLYAGASLAAPILCRFYNVRELRTFLRYPRKPE